MSFARVVPPSAFGQPVLGQGARMDPENTSRPRGSNFVADDAAARGAQDFRNSYGEAPDPYQDEARWPAWKVSVFVIVFSGLCWGAIAFVASRLFG